MPAGKADSDRGRHDQVLELISAVAAGDATHEDVVSALREKGIDALDVLVEVLVGATEKGAGRRTPPSLLNPQQLSTKVASKRTAETVHRAPRLPFLLQGTLYDPSDIERFNGTELHFVSTPGHDHLLVVDDRALMESWWQLSYVSANASPDLKVLPPRGGGSVGVTSSGGVGVVTSPEGEITGIETPFGTVPTTPPPPRPHTNFYEHVNYGGSRIELTPNTGYPDLTDVSYTFFGTGDWNDTISSVQMVATSVAVLYEHVGYAGSTYTTTQSAPNLGGWNDVASACATW